MRQFLLFSFFILIISAGIKAQNTNIGLQYIDHSTGITNNYTTLNINSDFGPRNVNPPAGADLQSVPVPSFFEIHFIQLQIYPITLSLRHNLLRCYKYNLRHEKPDLLQLGFDVCNLVFLQ